MRWVLETNINNNGIITWLQVAAEAEAEKRRKEEEKLAKLRWGCRYYFFIVLYCLLTWFFARQTFAMYNIWLDHVQWHSALLKKSDFLRSRRDCVFQGGDGAAIGRWERPAGLQDGQGSEGEGEAGQGVRVWQWVSILIEFLRWKHGNWKRIGRIRCAVATFLSFTLVLDESVRQTSRFTSPSCFLRKPFQWHGGIAGRVPASHRGLHAHCDREQELLPVLEVLKPY